MIAEGKEDLPSNERYEGYCIDIIKEIAGILEFKYIIKLVDDGVHGRKNERGEWNGMIKELIEGVSILPGCQGRTSNKYKLCYIDRKRTLPWLT